MSRGRLALVCSVHPVGTMSAFGQEPADTFTDPGDVDLSETRVRVPVLTLALETQRPTAGGWCASLRQTSAVEIGRGARREGSLRSDGTVRLTVPDTLMSGVHARMFRESGRWMLQDAGSKNGIVVNGERIDSCRLAEGDLLQLGASFFIFRTYLLDPSWPAPERAGAFATLDLELAETFRQASRIAASMVSVLVVGETGAGKELVARELHRRSGRSGPFVAVNCGAIAPTLIESELFGYRRGAFSGAVDDHRGLVRSAEGGTLFLDEVAELTPHGQVALLRMLQERAVRPVGATAEAAVDVRVVAATHQDLRQRVADGGFRQDLYARLAGFVLEVPPLRHRRVDLGLILASLIARSDSVGVSVATATARALMDYAFPMNIRELEQILRSALALSGGGLIGLESLPPRLAASDGARTGYLSPDAERLRASLVARLRQHGGNVAATARAMEKAPVQIRRWCRRLGIDVSHYRPRGPAREA